MREYQLREVGGEWQVSCNGELFRSSPHRPRVIDMVACEERILLRSLRLLEPPDVSKQLSLVGFSLDELLASIVWQLKYPPVELRAFDDAETYFDPALHGTDSAVTAYLDYQHAMHQQKYSAALDQLILLGVALDLPSPYWESLQLLADSLWVRTLNNIPVVRRVDNAKQRSSLSSGGGKAIGSGTRS